MVDNVENSSVCSFIIILTEINCNIIIIIIYNLKIINRYIQKIRFNTMNEKDVYFRLYVVKYRSLRNL